MSRADQAVDSAADKLDTAVRSGQESGGLKAKVAEQFADDPQFLRKLKPSAVKARVKGEPEPPPTAPSGPQVSRPPKAKKNGGRSPWLVVAAAFAVGYTLAKVIDWRGHAHPHR
ncbi:MAG TPA: hypothetical protein VGQ38_16115 [Gaiellaceae bacterium]|jgi:hypothetical protein|nr:hypothetical protein [Gaiellaceae bacterium]